MPRCFLLVSALLLPATMVAGAEEVDFERDVAPLLSRHCVACHNAKTSRSGLDLSSHQSALRGGDGGPVIQPAKPAESALVQRATDGSMPPENDGRRLTAQEVALLAGWIKAGAPWPADRILMPIKGPEGSPPCPAAQNHSAQLATDITPTAQTRWGRFSRKSLWTLRRRQ